MFVGKEIIFVVGMHRSGTSALASALSEWGVDFGAEFIPPSVENPAGFFENPQVRAINDRLLNRLGRAWFEPFELPKSWIYDFSVLAAEQEIEQFLEGFFVKRPSLLLGLKDPRLCRLLPVWLRACEKYGVRTKAIIIARDPLEVAFSLYQRNRLLPHSAFALYRRYIQEAQSNCALIPTSLVSFLELITDPKSTLERLKIQLDIDIAKPSDLKSGIDKDLYRSRIDQYAFPTPMLRGLEVTRACYRFAISQIDQVKICEESVYESPQFYSYQSFLVVPIHPFLRSHELETLVTQIIPWNRVSLIGLLISHPVKSLDPSVLSRLAELPMTFLDYEAPEVLVKLLDGYVSKGVVILGGSWYLFPKFFRKVLDAKIVEINQVKTIVQRKDDQAASKAFSHAIRNLPTKKLIELDNSPWSRSRKLSFIRFFSSFEAFKADPGGIFTGLTNYQLQVGEAERTNRAREAKPLHLRARSQLSTTILIPVYNAYESVKQCLCSLISCTSNECDILIINDGSHDIRLLNLLREVEGEATNVKVHTFTRNQGYIKAVNYGIQKTDGNVLLLNSDTMVTPGWLEKLQRCLESDSRIGIVCPLSNNATLLSVPMINQDNHINIPIDIISYLVEDSSERNYPRIPTGVGYCMLIRRALFNDLGLFDQAYGKGYGEENDFSVRAWSAGYQIACADDTYVYHKGESSFSTVFPDLNETMRNAEILHRRFPKYHIAARKFCATNPLSDIGARLETYIEFAEGEFRPRLLFVTHTVLTIGGIESHLMDIVKSLSKTFRITILQIGTTSSEWVDRDSVDIGDGVKIVTFNSRNILADLAFIGIPGALADTVVEAWFERFVGHGFWDVIHFHHFAGWNSFRLPEIAKASGGRIIISIHDMFLICPDYNQLYLGEEYCGIRLAGQEEKCIHCLFEKSNIRFNDNFSMGAYLNVRNRSAEQALRFADVLVFPSAFIYNVFAEAFSFNMGEKSEIVPHGVQALTTISPPDNSRRLNVAFFGRFCRAKGADIFLEAVRRLNPGRFIASVIGNIDFYYTGKLADADINVRGPFSRDELQSALQGIDVVVIPSQFPETYCLTLSESQYLGVPAIASRIGAIPERVVDGQTGFLFEPGNSDDLCRQLNFVYENPDALIAVRRKLVHIGKISIEQNALSYTEIYEFACFKEKAQEKEAAAPGSDKPRLPCACSIERAGAEQEYFTSLYQYAPDAEIQDLPRHLQSEPLRSSTHGGIDNNESGYIGLKLPENSRKNLSATCDTGFLESRVHFVIFSRPEDEQYFESTLDSIFSVSAECQMTVVLVRGPDGFDYQAYYKRKWERNVEFLLVTNMNAGIINSYLLGKNTDWFFMLSAGDRVAVNKARFLGGVLDAASDPICCYYMDWELLTERGERYGARHLPSFNLELFRRVPGLIGALVIKSSAWEAVGGIEFSDRRCFSDLLFKTSERFGGEAVGNIPETLLMRLDFTGNEKLGGTEFVKVVTKHLTRVGCRSFAQWQAERKFISLGFPVERILGLSVILCVSGQFLGLPQCLKDLGIYYSKNGSDRFALELTILGPVELNHKFYSQREVLKNLGFSRIRVQEIETNRPYKSYDDAIRAAKGKYCVMLEGGLATRDPNWIATLMAPFRSDDVTAVCPTIRSDKGHVLGGGLILGGGREGIAIPADIGASSDWDCALASPLCTRDVSAATIGCLVIKKEDFLSIGGFDIRHYPRAYGILDYCIRLRKQKKRLIFNPSLVFYADERETRRVMLRSGLLQPQEDELACLFSEYLSEIAKDSHYNRNLSLRDIGKVEALLTPKMACGSAKKPRLVAYPFDGGGIGAYRVREPVAALERAGRFEAMLLEQGDSELPTLAEIERADVQLVYLHNALHTHQLRRIAQYRCFTDIGLVFGLDDLLTSLPGYNPFSKVNYPDMERRISKAVSLCDRLVTSSEGLKQAYRKYSTDVVVVPNYLGKSKWAAALSGPLGSNLKRTFPRVGWAGAPQHAGDLDILVPVMEALGQSVEWVFLGEQPRSVPAGCRVEFYPAVPVKEYPGKLVSLGLDLALAPLQINAFNEAKTNIKILEYGAAGYPVICSDIEPYRAAPVRRVNNDTKAWIEGIRGMLAEPRETHEAKQRLRHWVETYWLLEDNLKSWLDALDTGEEE